MFGRLPATSPRAIRTGSWLARKALTRAPGPGRPAAVLLAAALSLWPFAAHAGRLHHVHLPYPQLDWPFEIPGGQYSPVAWGDIAGWREDDQLQAFTAFRASCKPITAQGRPAAEPKALGLSLRDPCRAAQRAKISDAAQARAFFEAQFVPLRISRLGEGEGFVTGYYEPV